MGNPAFHLRPAGPDDDSLLLRIYGSTRADELALTTWTEAEKAGFCEMQHRAQDSHYRKHYPTAEFLLIESAAGETLGRVYIDRWPKEIRIMDLALLAEHRRQGIGTQVLSSLIAEASATGKILSIHVERENPALCLYRCLGFEQAGENGVHLLLHRAPEKPPP